MKLLGHGRLHYCHIKMTLHLINIFSSIPVAYIVPPRSAHATVKPSTKGNVQVSASPPFCSLLQASEKLTGSYFQNKSPALLERAVSHCAAARVFYFETNVLLVV